MEKSEKPSRKNFKYFHLINSRWMDNDVYGHINNVTYYSYFDTTVNKYLIDKVGLKIKESPIVGYVVSSNCSFLSGISYPDEIEVGMKVIKIGYSSVKYGLGIFRKGEEKVSAFGEFVHVFVNRNSKKPVEVPKETKKALEDIL